NRPHRARVRHACNQRPSPRFWLDAPLTTALFALASRRRTVAFPALGGMRAMRAIAATAVTIALTFSAGAAFAVRCHSRPGGGGFGAHCGLDSQTEPPDPMHGDPNGCTDASLATLNLFRRSHACRPGDQMVIYDLTTAFPNNGRPGDQSVAGATSYAIIRAT